MDTALNKDQKMAVTHMGSPLLVVAGPGSGKTYVIVNRILHLIKNGLKPSQILCLTFSEKAADEMRQRLEKIIDITDMQISTFHSFAKDLLQDNVLVSGIGMSAGIMSRSSQLVWGLKNIDNFGLQYIEIGNNAVEVIESIIDGISTFKDELVSHQELNDYLTAKLRQDLDEEQRSFYLKLVDMAKVYEKYQEFQRSKAVIDFDDMVVEAVKLLRKRIDIARKYQEKFRHIFVDEFQDNNFAQLELVKLISNNGNVTAVGDDDQCIYRFQGAYLTNFKDFATYFKNTTTIVLSQNYRSTKNIVKLANELLERVPERETKKLFSENEAGNEVLIAACSNENSEVEFVVKTINELMGKDVVGRNGIKRPLTYKDFAILSRKRKLGQKFANGLKAHGIPVAFIGDSNVFGMPIFKDFMCFLKIAKDPERAGMEIARLLSLAGITEQNLAEINRLAKKRSYNDPTDIDFVFDTLKSHSTINVTQRHTLMEVETLIEKLISLVNTSSLSDLVYKVIMSISGLYKQSLVSNKPEDRRNRTILKELHKISSEFESLNPHGSLSEFIDHLTLMGEFEIELDGGYENGDAVLVTTIHQSKGKEFPVVFIVDVATNKLPLRYQAKKFFVPRELSKGLKITEDEKELYKQEERRLLYVAMTRAQNLLFLSYAKKYGDNIRETKASQFLNEVNYDANPIIKVLDFEANDPELQPEFAPQDRIEHIRTQLQTKAIHSICQMNLKTAVEKIIELSKLDHYEKKGTFEGFDPDEVTKIVNIDDSLNNELQNIRMPLINKEDLKLSVSKLDTYEDCPLRFKFAHVLQIPTPPKTFFDLGTSVHAVVEHLTQMEKDGIDITEEIALEILDKEWIVSSFKTETEATEAKDKAKNMITTYMKWRSANPNTPMAAEQKFTIDIAQIPFNGSIDRIERTPQGDFEVIDFKTGGVYETKNSIKDDFQMNVYALATKKLYGKLPKKASLFYLKKDKIITNHIESSQLEKVQKVLEEKVNLILDEDFHATPSFEACRKCDFWNICESRKT